MRRWAADRTTGRFTMVFKNFAVLLVVLGMCAPAAAQQEQQQQPTAPAQPMTIETIHSGFVIAPDTRFTQVNDRSATLAGVYGGYLLEQTFLVGGAGYWLTNGDHDFEMAYGGAVVGWTFHGNRAISFGPRVLVGGGDATISSTYGKILNLPPGTVVGTRDVARFGSNRGNPIRPPITSDTRVIVSDDFFITEPQANVLWRLTDWMRIDLGVSYRLTAGTEFDDQLRGFAGMVAIRFGQ
jgi:hypothetical protein